MTYSRRYALNASNTTLETVRPSAAALTFTACQSASGTRIERAGVAGWFGTRPMLGTSRNTAQQTRRLLPIRKPGNRGTRGLVPHNEPVALVAAHAITHVIPLDARGVRRDL